MDKNKLKILRLKNKFTQDEMAEALYISQNAYSLIECGKTRLIDIERIKMIAEKFDVHPWKLGLFDELGLIQNVEDECTDFSKSYDLEPKELIKIALKQIEQLFLQNKQLVQLLANKK